MSTRFASHAGTWYSGQRETLDAELTGWLDNVAPPPESGFAPPIQGCKAIIAPHAGYSYSGRAAAWAYKCIDTTNIKRVFILGPSHHVYLDGCAVSKCKEYVTPIGVLPLDLDTIKELNVSGKFGKMNKKTDEAEHSIEMHLPYVRKMFEGQDIKIVPILIGAISQLHEAAFGDFLAPYLLAEDTFCVISSDFCHWGLRFNYTHYYPEPPPNFTTAIHLVAGQAPDALASHPIHMAISELDQEAMNILSMPPTSPAEVHTKFQAYLDRTKNTICGRHPIGVLLGALATIQREHGREVQLRWVRYEQSSKCITVDDSSVSYASAYVTF